MPIASPRHAHDPALVALGAAIKTARIERGVSQEELAHKSAIDRSYMSSIERGAQNPGIVSILRVAHALEMTATETVVLPWQRGSVRTALIAGRTPRALRAKA